MMSYFFLLPKNLISRGQDIARRRATSAFASSTIEIQSNISTSKPLKSCADLWVEWRCRHVVCVWGVWGVGGGLVTRKFVCVHANVIAKEFDVSLWLCEGDHVFPPFFSLCISLTFDEVILVSSSSKLYTLCRKTVSENVRGNPQP